MRADAEHIAERIIIAPDVFLPRIESMGLTSLTGRAIIDQACEEALKWKELACGGPQINVTVNCSAEESGTPDKT